MLEGSQAFCTVQAGSSTRTHTHTTAPLSDVSSSISCSNGSSDVGNHSRFLVAETTRVVVVVVIPVPAVVVLIIVVALAADW